MGLLDIFTGGKSGEATDYAKKALERLQGVHDPTMQELTLPELQQYAISQNMTPAQMQAFLQQSNAYNAPVNQTGTAAQIAAINQLANVANAGAEGSPTQQAQVEQINQDAARNLAGQRGAIEQAAASRGVPVGLLQAALSGQQAGQGLQDAHMAALQAQGQNYQQALAAMAQGAGAGQALQGQQNTQANTIAQAQNAMQQFNAANQQNASAANAGYQQGANAQNTLNANQVGAHNTELANQRTGYNAALPQQIYNNQLAKAQAEAGQYGNLADLSTGQGNQMAGLMGALTGLGVTSVFGGNSLAKNNKTSSSGAYKADNNDASTPGNMGQAAGLMSMFASKGGIVPSKGRVIEPYAKGGMVDDPDELLRRLMMLQAAGPQQSAPLPMRQGGMVPGRARVPGDSYTNDTVDAKLSPGELVVPRTAVPNVLSMMAQRQAPPPTQVHHPQDVAALLTAMRHLRGAAA